MGGTEHRSDGWFYSIFAILPLQKADDMATWPNPPLMEGPPGALTHIDGREYLYFGGTSYLGLAGREEVILAGCEALRRFGIHTSTSRSGYGNCSLTLQVERLAADFFGTAGAFYFASGYAGNHILIQALAHRADVALIDESAHFCLVEAAQLLGRPIESFRHGDPDDLWQKLHQLARQRPLVLTDGVFSMTGEVAPLDLYLAVLREYSTATLLVDDAHGIGTIGRNGRGTLEHLGLWDEAAASDPAKDGLGIFVCGTLSKAIGGHGGVLPGSLALLERVRQTSHYYEGASAPMSAAAGATARALEIVLHEPQLRRRLSENAQRLRGGLRALGLAADDWPSPIIGLSIGSSDNMRRIHDELRHAGIIVPYFNAYAGTGSAGRLRIAVFATHTDEMLDQLLDTLRRLL
jgi:8-amino-7-oxononanoate synthase